MKQKVCTKCEETKPTSEFNKNSKAKDGLRTYCRSCTQKASNQYYAVNKERLLEYKSQWNAANKERKAETTRQWNKANPKRRAYIAHKSTAKKRGIEFLLTFEEWCDWWGDDFAERGNTTGKLVMARFGDKGPYAIGNIKKITCNENMSEANDFRKLKDQAMLEV